MCPPGGGSGRQPQQRPPSGHGDSPDFTQPPGGQPAPEPNPVPPAAPLKPEDLLKDPEFKKGLLDLLRNNPDFKGPAGPQGPAGQDGKDGKDGADGTDGADAILDMAELARLIQGQVPGITVRTLNSKGEVVDSEYVPPGGVLNLHHKPIGGK